MWRFLQHLLLFALATPLLANPLKEKRQTPPYASQFIVRNSCPGPIILYIGDTIENRIQPGGNVTHFSAPGFFFTDAVGGHRNGSGTTRAGFFDVSGTALSFLITPPCLTCWYVTARLLLHCEGRKWTSQHWNERRSHVCYASEFTWSVLLEGC